MDGGRKSEKVVQEGGEIAGRKGTKAWKARQLGRMERSAFKFSLNRVNNGYESNATASTTSSSLTHACQLEMLWFRRNEINGSRREVVKLLIDPIQQ